MLGTTHHNGKRSARLDFDELESLRLFSRQILQNQIDSLEYFRYDVGFAHVANQNKRSVSSSATCILSLAATGSWKSGAIKSKAANADTNPLLKYLISRTQSPRLAPDN